MESSERKPRALAAVLIACAIAFGGVSGIVFDRLVLLPRAGYAGEVTPVADTVASQTGERRAQHHGMPGAGRPSGERYLLHLETELDLSPDQRERVARILKEQQELVMEITRESRPRIRAVADDTRAAIREVLTPEQWERFQEIRQNRDRRTGGVPGWNGSAERMRDSLTAAPPGTP
jgi:Spy/CpxP family protein refolding chaperone